MEDRESARAASRALAPLLSSRGSLRFQVEEPKGQTETAVLPQGAIRLLVDLLTEMAKGNTVRLIPIHAELTTQEAADILNVSRPFLIEQITNKKIPAHKVGTHRRIRYSDLMAYKQHMDNERSRALDELANQAQELKMGY